MPFKLSGSANAASALDGSAMCRLRPPGQRQRNVLRFYRESTRDSKNVCDTVVAHFFKVTDKSFPRAFHAKARSHSAAAVPGGLLGRRHQCGGSDHFP